MFVDGVSSRNLSGKVWAGLRNQKGPGPCHVAASVCVVLGVGNARGVVLHLGVFLWLRDRSAPVNRGVAVQFSDW